MTPVDSLLLQLRPARGMIVRCCLVVAYWVGSSLASIRRDWREVDPVVWEGHWAKDEDQSLLGSVFKRSTCETIHWHLVSRDVEERSLTTCFRGYTHLSRTRNVERDFQDSENWLLIESNRIRGGRNWLKDDSNGFFKVFVEDSIDLLQSLKNIERPLLHVQ